VSSLLDRAALVQLTGPDVLTLAAGIHRKFSAFGYARVDFDEAGVCHACGAASVDDGSIFVLVGGPGDLLFSFVSLCPGHGASRGPHLEALTILLQEMQRKRWASVVAEPPLWPLTLPDGFVWTPDLADDAALVAARFGVARGAPWAMLLRSAAVCIALRGTVEAYAEGRARRALSVAAARVLLGGDGATAAQKLKDAATVLRGDTPETKGTG
jgi:hypothetical protein